MEQFASGWKRHYYGKGDVIVYRLNRDGKATEGGTPLFGASVLMLLYGDAFWPTYATGDNTGLIATDSMRNFIQRESLDFVGHNLESYCRFLATRFLDAYPQVEGLQVSAVEIPYRGMENGVAFEPSGPDRATATIEMTPGGIVDVASGVRGFRLLRLGGSAFHGFVRDQYTTLPDAVNRPLHMWLDLEWRYATPDAAFSQGRIVGRTREIVREAFQTFASGSIQQLIHETGTRILAALPELSEIHLEANNRTWDTIAERGDELGIYTDSRPPYGCLGLRLTRQS